MAKRKKKSHTAKQHAAWVKKVKGAKKFVAKWGNTI